jgi:hypothetical protein
MFFLVALADADLAVHHLATLRAAAHRNARATVIEVGAKGSARWHLVMQLIGMKKCGPRWCPVPALSRNRN